CGPLPSIIEKAIRSVELKRGTATVGNLLGATADGAQRCRHVSHTHTSREVACCQANSSAVARPRFVDQTSSTIGIRVTCQILSREAA
ncbi:hypothetical protein FRC08_016229, partial [Ceratobasidium sp. 394]